MYLPLAEAAPVLGTSPRTLRRWVREGCPSVHGGVGRGKSARVDPAAVREWRASKAAPNREASLRELASLALDFHRRGREPKELGQRVVGIPDAKAAALLVFFLNYLAERWRAEDFHAEETDLLTAIALQNGHAVSDPIKLGSSRISDPDK